MAKVGRLAVIGAAGEIGKVLTPFLKLEEMFDSVALYDIANVGISEDAKYIPSSVSIEGYRGPDTKALEACLQGANIVVFIAGMPWKDGMNREKMFAFNAKIVAETLETVIQLCPKAHLVVVTNPVNSIVPLIHGIYARRGLQSPSVFGLTTLDVMRAKIIVGWEKKVPAESVDVSVVGGHSDKTMLPLLSSIPGIVLTEAEQARINCKIVNCVYEVAQARDNLSSASLSTAYAIYDLIRTLGRRLLGQQDATPLFAYVKDDASPSGYFASKLVVGTEGLERLEPLPVLSAGEQKKLEKVHQGIALEVQLAEKWLEENFTAEGLYLRIPK
eukprot:GHVU01151620.1.p1 GENE.GHVU01151620.1~~GHVU01151620.1.p1  ORF type:complete len:330 (+),score=44.32 GHVU01151620.1:82-1071(+)